MTEQEKTELALKAAQEKKVKEQAQTLGPNQIQLDSRVVTLKPWTGKTKKKFKKEFEFIEDIQDVDFKKILDILVYEHTKEDYLFTDQELQFILSQLKLMSIGDEFTSDTICPKCQTEQKLHGKVSENVAFTPGKLPSSFKEYKFENVSKTMFDKVVQDIMESEDYDGLTKEPDIEVACRIKYKNLSPKQMINHFDNLPLKDIKELMNDYESKLAAYKLSKKDVCRNCQTEQEFDLDIISGIFEELAE